MEYRINDTYRLRLANYMNLELMEVRAPDTVMVRGGVADVAPKWMGTGHYFQRVGDALTWLLDHRMIADPGECATVGDAVEKMRAIADELRAVEVEASL